MKKPFVLFPIKKQGKLSRAARKRLESSMQYQVKEFEWLPEASSSSPEQVLGVAVLQRAVLDLITPGVQDRDREDAMKWVKGEFGEQFEESYPLSFSNISQSFTKMTVQEFRSKVLAFVETANRSEENANGFRFQRA